MITTKLNEPEFKYLTEATFLNTHCKELIQNSVHKAKQAYLLKISDEIADEIRDLCGEQLQIVGFDDDYHLTQEGEILEDLVDKFYLN